MYNKDNFDHIFYRIKKSIPSSYNLYLLIAILKVYPLLLLTHTGGYTNPPEKFIKIHTYFRYFSITFCKTAAASSSAGMVLNIPPVSPMWLRRPPSKNTFSILSPS